MKIKLSKSQWEQIGEQTGWINKKAIFGPGFADFYGSEAWKSQFGKLITTNIIIDNTPLVMSTQMGGDESQVVIVEHNGEHIGVYDPKRNGFDVTYTKHIEKYNPFKTQIDEEAKKILKTQPNEVQAKIKNIKTIKLSQSHMLDENKSKILQAIFDAIPGKEGKDHITNKTTSKEVMDEAIGRMWIQAYLSSDLESMSVSRYYESEYYDQQWGKTIKVPINWENPEETTNKIMATFQSLKNK